MISLINRWFITQYQKGFPKREFIFERFIIADFTKSKTRYYDLIRLLCLLFNCRCLRDETGVYRDFLYFVGRKNSVKGIIYFLRLLVIEVEHSVEDSGDFWNQIPQPSNIKPHKSSYLASQRIYVIKKFTTQLKNVLSLKKEFYYNKYASVYQIKQNETFDQTFFAEFIRENRLSHLKPFNNAEPPTRPTKGETIQPE